MFLGCEPKRHNDTMWIYMASLQILLYFRPGTLLDKKKVTDVFCLLLSSKCDLDHLFINKTIHIKPNKFIIL